MAKETIVIIDYGSGNLRSAAKAFECVAPDSIIKISNKSEDILKADRIVLPGQGAFGDCMRGLQVLPGMIEALNETILKKARPFLGICVGMQLMATRGLENGVHAGLNWIEGEVVPLKPKDKNLKIPHMGWNDIVFPSPGLQDNRHIVLRSTESSNNFYFVHSFVFQCVYSRHLLAMTEYGELIPAIVGRENMIGVQFHPEKSHKDGLKLISDFVNWKP